MENSSHLDSTKIEDEEVIQNLDILLNMESLEQSDFWEELINLSQLEATAEDEEGE